MSVDDREDDLGKITNDQGFDADRKIGKNILNNLTDSVASTERELINLQSKHYPDNQYKLPSEVKVASFKSPQGEVIKKISSSVLGDRSKYGTKLPNISRQPILDGKTISDTNAPASEDVHFNSHKGSLYEGARTQKAIDFRLRKRTKKGSISEQPEFFENKSNIMKFINPGEVNMMEKLLDSCQIKPKTEGMSFQFSKYKQKSPRLHAIQSKNLPYNDSAELLKKAKQLEAQLKALDDEYEILKEDNEELSDQNNYMKELNKKLFKKLRDDEGPQNEEIIGRQKLITYRKRK
jgi:hypothetical protein